MWHIFSEDNAGTSRPGTQVDPCSEQTPTIYDLPVEVEVEEEREEEREEETPELNRYVSWYYISCMQQCCKPDNGILSSSCVGHFWHRNVGQMVHFQVHNVNITISSIIDRCRQLVGFCLGCSSTRGNRLISNEA